jgi:hypothetical protein
MAQMSHICSCSWLGWGDFFGVKKSEEGGEEVDGQEQDDEDNVDRSQEREEETLRRPLVADGSLASKLALNACLAADPLVSVRESTQKPSKRKAAGGSVMLHE